MNEHQFASRIRQALNEGTRAQNMLSAHVSERLRAARERALERRTLGAAEREPALAWAGELIGGFGGVGGFSLRVLLPTALLAASLIAIYSLQQDQRAAEVEELDALLLTDDLPIDAYLDRGFETWLKKVSSR